MPGQRRSARIEGAQRQRRQLTRRTIPAAVAALALLIPFAVALTSVWRSTAEDVLFVDRERDGVAYLRPLVRLLAATMDAQGQAVAAQPVNRDALAAAVRDVEDVDERLGSRLGTSDRWSDLKGRLDPLAGSAETGRDALRSYSVIIDLEAALIARVGDTSNLILDPELDAYYVMDTALVRVPAIIADVGRATDLAALSQAPTRQGRAERDDAAVSSAVVFTRVRSNSAAIDVGLRKSLGTTQSRSLGPGVLSQLDRLRDATTAFTPPADEVGVSSGVRSVEDLRVTRRGTQNAALELESAALTELDALLASRRADLAGRRSLVIGLTLAGLAVALASAGFTGVIRRRPAAEGIGPTDGEDRDDAREAAGEQEELIGVGPGERYGRP